MINLELFPSMDLMFAVQFYLIFLKLVYYMITSHEQKKNLKYLLSFK